MDGQNKEKTVLGGCIRMIMITLLSIAIILTVKSQEDIGKKYVYS